MTTGQEAQRIMSNVTRMNAVAISYDFLLDLLQGNLPNEFPPGSKIVMVENTLDGESGHIKVFVEFEREGFQRNWNLDLLEKAPGDDA